MVPHGGKGNNSDIIMEMPILVVVRCGGDIFCSGNISKTENGDTTGLGIKKWDIIPLVKWNTMVYTEETLDNIMRYNTYCNGYIMVM